MQTIVDRKEIRPILSHLLIRAEDDHIEIFATNLEVSIKETCPAEVVQKGSIVIDAKKIYEIVRELPEKTICLERQDNNRVKISTDDILFNLVGLDPDEFPEINFLDSENFQEIDRAVIRELIEKTLYASSNDETKHHLNGVFFEKQTRNEKEILRAVATDGHRLSMVEKDITTVNEQGFLEIEQLKKGVIFPKRGLVELRKVVDEDPETKTIYFLCKENSGFFKKRDVAIAIRTIDEEFPNFSQAIPEDIKQEIVISRLEFLGALKRISIVAEEKSKAIHLDISKGTMNIYASNPILGEGRETIPIEHQGEEIRLGFNAGYLIDVLNAIKSEKVIIKLRDNESPVILTPLNGEEYTCIIMPMEIND